jgi:hypothetical protein
MAKPRRTVRLRDLVAWVNERNRCSTCDPKVREGWNALLDAFLMEAEAYAGFGFLTSDELAGEARGQPPGIVRDDTGNNCHAFPDETRIKFYLSRGL